MSDTEIKDEIDNQYMKIYNNLVIIIVIIIIMVQIWWIWQIWWIGQTLYILRNITKTPYSGHFDSDQ